ncbi:MAG: RNA 2',3'-cyclic phosphodiesterase [Candidatus Eiseniibacteriota bacterium]
MRTFIAVFPSSPAQEAAHRVIERLRRPEDDVSWVRRENLHYTLRFLGELDEDAVSRLIAAAREGAGERPRFTATLGAAGAFPSPRRARVLWLGLSHGAEALTALAGGLEGALVGHGFAPAERPFSPHLTLGRLRRRDQDWSARLAGVAAGPEGGPAPGFVVDRVAIVGSTLSPGGSIYRLCAEPPLAD